MRSFDPMRGGGISATVLGAVSARVSDQLRPPPPPVVEDFSAQLLTEYLGRPLAFARDVLGVQPWDKMAEVLQSVLGHTESYVVGEHGLITEIGDEAAPPPPGLSGEALKAWVEGWDETYVRAGQKVSKTMGAAVAAEYWHSVTGRPFVTTAPTGRQMRNLTWRQIRVNRMKAKRRGYKLPGRLLEVEVKNEPHRPDLYGYGFTAENAEGAQGLHSELGLLIIVDEAAGVSDEIWTAIKGSIEEGCKLLAIGNPNKRRSQFRTAFFERLGTVGTVHISSLDSPNVRARKTLIKGLAGRKWCNDRKADWGEESVEYKTKVLGEFPSDADEKAIPMDYIAAAFALGEELAAQEAEMTPEEHATLCRIVKACLDVARAGGDHNALTYLAGQRIRVALYFQEPDTMQTAAKTAAWVSSQAATDKPEQLIVDIGAVGGGVHDRLREMAAENPAGWGECDVVELDWGRSPVEPTRYCKLVDELYGNLRHRLNPKTPIEERLGLPTEAELLAVGLTREKFAAQLNARKADYDETNKFKVETKKQLRKRFKELDMDGRSPDIADSVAGLMLRRKDNTVRMLVF